MNSAYNQMPPDEQSRRLTQFVIGNQQYEFNRLFYGISIGPAAFSAFMSKIFGPLILKKNAITYLDCFYAITDKRRNVYSFRTLSQNTSERKSEGRPRQITLLLNTS